MPYIRKETRAVINRSKICEVKFRDNEELCYALLQLVLQYCKGDPALMNESIGTLESAKQELFRKHINPRVAQAEFDIGGS